MAGRLEGKRALVTAAGQGIGRATALAFADEGATVSLEPILFRSDDTVFGKDNLSKVKVEAKVLGHQRGPKLTIFKFKPKRGYKRKTGHRQELTRLEITGISNGS